MWRTLVAIIGIWLVFPTLGFAQITSQALGGGPSLEVSPAYPTPGSEAVVRLNNYAGGTEENSILWTINGVEQVYARNQRELPITTGGPSERMTIEAITGRGRIQKVISPQYVDIIVEPQTRVPAHYGGRALPSIGSSVNATAITSDPTPTQNLIYTWRLNGTALSSGPVRGQSQISFTMPTGGGILEVLIETTSGVVGAQTVQLMNTDPFLRFYSNNSLYGLSLIPIGSSLTLVGNSATVRAEPYYLDLRTFNNPDLAQWDAGTGKAASLGANPYELNLVRGDASRSVGFHVRNLTNVLQGAQGGFNIQ